MNTDEFGQPSTPNTQTSPEAKKLHEVYRFASWRNDLEEGGLFADYGDHAIVIRDGKPEVWRWEETHHTRREAAIYGLQEVQKKMASLLAASQELQKVIAS